MKNNGFTLAEILISVGIVGVIATIMLPMINKYKPDSNKILYLKTYNQIVKLMPSLVGNTKAFPIVNKNNSLDKIIYSNYPLFNIEAPYTIDGVSISGAKKFCRLLASGLNIVGEITCSDNYDSSETPEFKKSFTTVDGVDYMVQTKRELKDSVANYQSNIYIDVDGINGSNCFTHESGCITPDRFKIMVSSDGMVIAGDPLGQYYLDTRTNWKLNRDFSTNGPLISTLPPQYNDYPVENLPPEDIADPEDNDNSDPENDDPNDDPPPTSPVPTPIKNTCYGGLYTTKHFIYDGKAGSWEGNTCQTTTLLPQEHIQDNLDKLKKTSIEGLYLYNNKEYVYYSYEPIMPKSKTYRPAWVVLQYQKQDGTVITQEAIDKYIETGACDQKAQSGKAKTCFGIPNPPYIYSENGADKINNNGQSW